MQSRVASHDEDGYRFGWVNEYVVAERKEVVRKEVERKERME